MAIDFAMAVARRALLAVCAASFAAAQLPGMPGGPPTEARPVFKSAKLLECTVCKRVADELWKKALDLRETAPYKKPSEDMYFDAITEVCNPDKDLGEWITFLDITQADAGAPLRLEDQEYLGECRRECRTIAKACNTVVEEHREDMAESFYKRDASTKEKFANRLCNKWAKVCPAKPLKQKKLYAHPDEYWMPVDEEMYKMRKMQDMINTQANKYGKQPVQFVDPMSSAMFGHDEDDEWGMPDL